MVKRAPSFPHLTDEYEPTNPPLWEKVKAVARGDSESLTMGGRTITRPKNRYIWPSPPASAWAIKQYNGFGGGWHKKAILRVLEAGGIVSAKTEPEVTLLHRLARECLVQRLELGYWEATPRLLRAALGDDLRRNMTTLLQNYNENDAKALGAWIEDKFRVESPKTPRGAKDLKETAKKMVWVLKYRMNQSQPGSEEKVRNEVAADWAKIEPRLDEFVNKFTDEGGTIVPKEMTVGNVTYVNRAGVTEPNLRKYAKRLGALFFSLQGWRAKAVKGNFRVVLASPKDFQGTAGGKYRQSEDALYVRTTPAVLKRGSGYGSFDYIVVHELGHRYDKVYGSGFDFDRQEWWTTPYSRKDGFGGLSESFAELFALGHFKLKGPWDPKVEKFEALMTTGKMSSRIVSRWKQALQELDPRSLKKIIEQAVRRTRDFEAHLTKFRGRKGSHGKWTAEAFVEYKFPANRIPVQPGRVPVLAPLRLFFEFDPTKAMTLVADVKSPTLGITKKVYENHRITGDYERTIRSVLLSHQPEVVWK